MDPFRDAESFLTPDGVMFTLIIFLKNFILVHHKLPGLSLVSSTVFNE